MSFTLVSAGAVVSTGSPKFGKATTAGNLLVAWVCTASMATSNPVTTTATGWALAVSGGAKSGWVNVWYRAKCNANESPPVFKGTATFTRSMLAEYSGTNSTSPLDQTGATLLVSSRTATAVCSAADSLSNELLAACGMWTATSSGPTTIAMSAIDGNHSSVVLTNYNNATAASTQFYDFSWGVTGSSGSFGDSVTASLGLTTANTSLCAASFKYIIHTGAFNITLPQPVTTFSARTIETGAFNAVISAPVTGITGHVTEHGSFTTALPLLHTALSGSAIETGALSVNLPPLSLVLAGYTAEPGSLHVAIPALKTSVTGYITESGTLRIALPLPVTTLNSQMETGALRISLPSPSPRVTGNTSETGTLAVKFPALSAVISAVNVESGALHIGLPGPAASVHGYTAETSAFHIELPAPAVNVTSYATETGALGISVPLLLMSAAGHTTEPGSLVISLPAVSFTVTGHVAESGELNVAVPPAGINFTGVVESPYVPPPQICMCPISMFKAAGAC